MKRLVLSYLIVFLTISCVLKAQTSPLSTGKWSKIGALKQGIYKLTGAQLWSLGFTLPITSSQLQLFGFDLSNLGDKVPNMPALSLTENAIKIVDGGDGQINATDYILFYNQGPIQWKYDSVINRMVHTNYSSSDTVFYFLTLGQNGKRIGVQDLQSQNTISKEIFSQHFLFEKDSVSLLNSGKTFYGPPMGVGSGKITQYLFLISTQGMNALSELKSYYHVASTTYQENGQFDFTLNDQMVKSSILLPVTGMLYDDIASEKIDSFSVNAQAIWPAKSTLKIAFNSTNSTSTGWIDFMEIHAKKTIGFWQDSTLAFAIEEGFSSNKIANCKIQNLDPTAIIWNVSNIQNPQEIKWVTDVNGNGYFLQSLDALSNFFGVRQSAFETPSLLGAVNNQNIPQNNIGVDYVIITAPAFLNAANRYQKFQQTQFGRKTIVVNAKELYNDFSGGQVSAVGIRNYLKSLMNSALQNNVNAPKYLLLIGIGNFNYHKINIEQELPTYESINSNSILSSFSTDDFFSALNTNDDINNYNALQQLQLSVGRLPARTSFEADTIINKLINYQTYNIGGTWENKITWVADDGDYNLHLQDAESIINHLQTKAPQWDQNKIYLDFFTPSSSSSGNTYPLAYNAIQQSIQDGTLLLNYTGHGNYLRLSEEAVIAQTQFDLWKNSGKLPLMVTASCNFAPFDQPGLQAIAWDALMKNSNGIIGLVAANRLVFAYSNKQINDLFIQQLLVKNSNGIYNSIGEALQKAKTADWANGGDRVNDLKFNLIGDPALKLNLPNYQINIQKINDKNFIGHDTLVSGTKYTMQGNVLKDGLPMSNYNGLLEMIIYDAAKTKKTLANLSSSMSVPIMVQENILFKGKASVINGKYNIDFLLPVQVVNSSNPLRVELATLDTNYAASIILDSIYVKYNQTLNNQDTIGPKITAFLNDPLFKKGGWAMANSTLYIHLSDSSGIQTSGNILGHDLSIWIDSNPIQMVLNNYFVTDVDTYKSGKIQYALPMFSAGLHRIIIKAWDLFGNSSMDTLTFEVPKTDNLQIKNATNYPNPFVDKTRFSFEINQIGETDQILFEVFDWSGKLLYTQNNLQVINQNRIYFDWDGSTIPAIKLSPGIYFYKFSVKSNASIVTTTNTFIKL
jgi:Peptidase family C25